MKNDPESMGERVRVIIPDRSENFDSYESRRYLEFLACLRG
ncbi:MAG: hypothetical protein QHH00_07440 [Methanomassiliicoccales archaeon]|nr:hypothetical protein [Methanomassiliicoccales archaeon]